MKNLKRILKSALFVLALAFVFANPVFAKKNPSVLKKLPQRMMWEIDSPAGTKIYVMGTVHIVDDSLTEIDPDVIQMFLDSDIIYAELAAEDLNKATLETTRLILSTMEVDENKKLKNVSNYLSKSELEYLNQIIRKSSEQTAKMDDDMIAKSFYTMPPWALESVVASYAYTSMGYTEQGIDFALYQIAGFAGKKVLGLDKLQVQLDLLHYGTYEEQLESLKLTLAEMKSGEYKQLVTDIFDYYKSDNIEGFVKLMAEEDEMNSGTLSEEYLKAKNKIVLDDRNASWAKQIEKMLKKKNKTIFIYAGAAHWTCPGNVFELLENKGVLVRE